MEPFADNFIPVVPVDEGLHDETHPFCYADPACPCHDDDEAIEQVSRAVEDGLITPEEATDFVLGRLL